MRGRYLALFAAGLACGGAGGWISGRQATSPDKGGVSGVSGAEAESSLQAWEAKARKAAGDRAKRDGRTRPVSPAESQEFADSVRSIFHENMEDRRMAMLDSLLERVGPEHYGVVVSLIRENDLRGTGNAGEWSMLWSKWGSRDPIGALEFVKQHDWQGWNDAARVEAVNRTLTYWSQADPEAARAYVESSAELAGGDRSMVWGLVRGWANVDPAATADWLFKSGLGMSGEYETVVKAMARRGGHEELDAWFEKVNAAGSPEKDLQGFAQTITQTKLAYEPEKAASWVELYLEEPWLKEGDIVEMTAATLSNRDPKSAMDWATRLGHENASAVAMANWCQRDIQAAQAWFADNTDSPGYGSAAQMMIHYLQRRDPAAAKNWAESLGNEQVREQILQRLEANH